MSSDPARPLTPASVKAAHELIQPYIHKTPEIGRAHV